MRFLIREDARGLKGPRAGKIGELELLFDDPEDGPLYGLRLLGFMVKQDGKGAVYVDLPGCQYEVSGERRRVVWLRGIDGFAGFDVRLKDLAAFEWLSLTAEKDAKVQTTEVQS